MLTVECEIRGIAVMLQNNALGSDEQIKQKGRRATSGAFNNPEEWRGKLHRCKDGTIGHPAVALERMLETAAREFKADKRRTMKEVVKACIFVKPDMIPINNAITEPDFIHEAQAVNPNTRGRGIRYRPAFKEGWTMKFNVEIDDADAVPPDRLKEMLDFAGKRIGLGDWRPRYGRFVVSEYKY